MSVLEVVVIAVGLAMDAFAVSLAAGAGRYVRSPRPALRLAFHLGLFQALMPVLGWLLGTRAAASMAAVDHWVAFGLLTVVGLRMVWAGLSPGDERATSDPSRGLTLVSLAVATSIDAFAVGLSLAVLRVTIWYPVVVIGLVTAALSFLGIGVGARVGDRFGRPTEVLGGILLIAIGVRIVVAHSIG